MKEPEIFGNDYNPFLIEITEQIQQARIHAAQLVNKELTKFYWGIGERIVVAQKKHGWGEAIVRQLSKDLIKSFPGTAGFSSRNLWIMR